MIREQKGKEGALRYIGGGLKREGGGGDKDGGTGMGKEMRGCIASRMSIQKGVCGSFTMHSTQDLAMCFLIIEKLE